MIFVVVLITHWIAQFVGWAYAERSAPMRMLWTITAFPLLHVANSLANQYFWTLATLNSVTWAAAFTYLISRHLLSRAPSPRNLHR